MESDPSTTSAAPRKARGKWWLLVAAVGLVTTAATVSLWVSHPKQPRYVGNQSCATCHAEIAAAYATTAHAQTSSQATADTVHGDFSAQGNLMLTRDPDLHFRMESEGGRFTQTAVRRTPGGETEGRTEEMDIVIGSGRKGQTYLHWEGDALCQLPVSYWTEQRRWVNSPGFADGTAKFDRPITGRCLECHASQAVSQAPPINRFDRASLVLGISCEKCHGPGGEHVDRFAKLPKLAPGDDSGIVNPARLSRDRQIDVCALCHAGEGRSITPPSTFKPGDVLWEHIQFPRQARNAPLDVHANQIQLLQRSRCYQESTSMTCTTCHDVHRPQRDVVAMATACMQCHQVDHCGKFAALGAQITGQCVNCHMPVEKTSQIVISDETGGILQPKVRNHRIAVYPETPLP